jgi:hypothetical protein
MTKLNTTLAGVATGLSLIACQQSQAITLGFANTSNSKIVFNGNSTFDFVKSTSPTADQFLITSSDGTGDSVGDFGNISGTFTIGAISGNSAAVTGTGTVTIMTGSGNLTGTINWNEISYSSSGTLNVAGLLDLTGITYPGTQSDLGALATAGSAIDKVTFTYTSPETLAMLKSTASSTTFAGVITTHVPDGGVTIMLLGLGLAALGFRARQTA